VFSVGKELGIYIPQDNIHHSHRRENLKSYKSLTFTIMCSMRLKGVKLTTEIIKFSGTQLRAVGM
jgi:hypothetical protein